MKFGDQLVTALLDVGNGTTASFKVEAELGIIANIVSDEIPITVPVSVKAQSQDSIFLKTKVACRLVHSEPFLFNLEKF